MQARGGGGWGAVEGGRGVEVMARGRGDDSPRGSDPMSPRTQTQDDTAEDSSSRTRVGHQDLGVLYPLGLAHPDLLVQNEPLIQE